MSVCGVWFMVCGVGPGSAVCGVWSAASGVRCAGSVSRVWRVAGEHIRVCPVPRGTLGPVPRDALGPVCVVSNISSTRRCLELGQEKTSVCAPSPGTHWASGAAATNLRRPSDPGRQPPVSHTPTRAGKT